MTLFPMRKSALIADVGIGEWAEKIKSSGGVLAAVKKSPRWRRTANLKSKM